MEPEIQAGDMVVIRSVEAASIEEGDVITYDSNGELGGPQTDRVTHRVIDVRRSDGGLVFQTKGDANGDPDPSQVTGQVWFHIPEVGHAVLFAQQPQVQGGLILVPGVLLMLSGMKTLCDAAVTTEAEDGTDGEGNADGSDD